MDNRASRHKFFSFPTFFVVFVLLNLLGVTLGLRWLWGMLEQYETSTPVNALKGVMAQLDENAVGFLAQHSGFVPGEFSTEKQFETYLRTKLGETPYQFTYRETARDGGDTLRYELLCNERKIATARFARQQDKGVYGFDVWKLDELEELYQYQVPLVVLASEGVRVTVDGTPLGEKHRVERDKTPDAFGKLPEGVAPPRMLGYEVLGLLADPVIEAVGLDGQDCRIRRFGNEAMVLVPATPEQEAQWTPKAQEIASLYARFITKDAEGKELAPLLLPGGALAGQIANFYNGWYIPHDSYEITGMKVDEFLVYGQDFFSCNVSFTYTIRKGHKSYDYPSAYTLYYVRQNGNWLVSDLKVN